MALNRPSSRKCSSCGKTLSNVHPAAPQESAAGRASDEAGELCARCRIIQTLECALTPERAMIPEEQCPRCLATKVLRTPGPEREEVLICAHCDHIWSRARS